MALYWFLAWVAGIAMVIQSGSTKQIAKQSGLASILHISNLTVLIGGLIIFTIIMAVTDGDFAKLLRGKVDPRQLNVWFLIPGACGLLAITISPLAISRIGALQVFCAMVFGQVIGSAIWDYKFEGISLDRYRVVGIALTLLGAVSMSFSGGKQ
jgi:uncharacterized membrane protein YdcZ (DUF606 family)